ncbi:SH3 domain-containing protein [Roseibium sp. SCP14]|uniref:SH3 domain-containing protein n=1 Tax=Roseibium sp. SCP14 TaxID=3141375 RepID=UPI00333C1A1D
MPSQFTHAAPLVFSLALAAPLSSGQANAQGAIDAEGFREIRVGPGVATAPDFIDVLVPFLKTHPESAEGSAGMDLNIRKEGSGYHVNIRLTGYLDDSVFGEHFRGYVIRTSTGEWELLSMSVKTLCARGQNVNGVCTSAAQPPKMFLTPGASPTGVSMCVNVAEDDVLNVRAGPGTRFEPLGALTPGDCSVELSDICESRWCEIRADTISGWVNTRYLAPSN